MPGVQLKNAPDITDHRQDISEWLEGDITTLSKRAKKVYNRRKAAIEAYFTTNAPLDELASQYHFSEKTLLKWAKRCLMQHEDGNLCGFRALLTGITVINHKAESSPVGAGLASALSIDPVPSANLALSSTPTEQDLAQQEEIESTIRPSEESSPIETGLVPAFPISRSNFISGRQVLQRRLIRKRWKHDTRQRRKRFYQVVSLSILAVLLLFILVPMSSGLAAYNAYSNVNALAHDGLNHLLDVRSLLPVSKSDPTAALNVTKLQQARVDFQDAQSDFEQLQQLINHPDVQSAVTQFAPQYVNKLNMARRLVQVALDISNMGEELTGVGLIAANIVHSSPLAAGSAKPLISVADITAIEAAITHTLYYIGDIRSQMSQVSVNELPFSASQKAQLASLMIQLPNIENTIVQVQGLVGLVSWLLGIGHPRRFLVQTMDTAELRPGGGFTGQYGVLQIYNGRMAPFTLTDVTLLDYAGNGTAIGRPAPPGYNWMNFGNWGVRDSNLSGDFPTTARMTMQVFEQEGGGPVDGDIALTPAVIGHVIDVTGPITVPEYHVTITSKNLEAELHYYQQNPLAIALEKEISGNHSNSGRKAFTSLLGKLLLDRVRHLPLKDLLAIGKQALKDIQTRDLEIYFADPAAEAWLVEHGYSGSLDTFSKQDGFVVIQANISISKASQYVQTTEEDDVMLDSSGGATHNLTITLDYQQRGPVYGYDTYADYIRVYAPANAQFLGGIGFDTGQALCTPKAPPSSTPPPPTTGQGAPPSKPPSPDCAQYNTSFPSTARYCPDGNYSLGERGYIYGKGYTMWPIDKLGPPTALSSDLPGHAMWGGLTETPKNCISYIWLSWYVPHAVKNVNGQPSYAILMQKQSGVTPTLVLNIDASAIKGLRSFSFDGTVYTDRLFSLQPVGKKR